MDPCVGATGIRRLRPSTQPRLIGSADGLLLVLRPASPPSNDWVGANAGSCARRRRKSIRSCREVDADPIWVCSAEALHLVASALYPALRRLAATGRHDCFAPAPLALACHPGGLPRRLPLAVFGRGRDSIRSMSIGARRRRRARKSAQPGWLVRSVRCSSCRTRSAATASLGRPLGSVTLARPCPVNGSVRSFWRIGSRRASTRRRRCWRRCRACGAARSPCRQGRRSTGGSRPRRCDCRWGARR